MCKSVHPRRWLQQMIQARRQWLAGRAHRERKKMLEEMREEKKQKAAEMAAEKAAEKAAKKAAKEKNRAHRAERSGCVLQ